MKSWVVTAPFLGVVLVAAAARAAEVPPPAAAPPPEPPAAAVSMEADSAEPAVVDGAAPPRPESGFEHGLRLGLSYPAGESSDGRALADDVVRRVPIMADIGYRASRVLYLGLVGMVGVDVATDDCSLSNGTEGASCTVEGWRVGLEVMVHPMPVDTLDLWLGAALGWERLEQKAVLPPPADAMGGFGTTLRTGEEGPALDLQGGIDFPTEGKLGFGPFADYTVGTYVRRTSDCPPDSACPSDIDETGLHHWLTLGVRGKFGP